MWLQTRPEGPPTHPWASTSSGGTVSGSCFGVGTPGQARRRGGCTRAQKKDVEIKEGVGEEKIDNEEKGNTLKYNAEMMSKESIEEVITEYKLELESNSV